MRATCPVYFILLNLIVLIIFDEEYVLYKSAYSFLHPHVTFSFLSPQHPVLKDP
jgi:hypothetical protein